MNPLSVLLAVVSIGVHQVAAMHWRVFLADVQTQGGSMHCAYKELLHHTGGIASPLFTFMLCGEHQRYRIMTACFTVRVDCGLSLTDVQTRGHHALCVHFC